ncbi:MAG: hypothetical protein Q9196_003349 [Gyalolechia fulgens]
MMLPPPKPRARLHIHHDALPAEELIFQANAQLSLGQSRKAIELYTEVLYVTAPGHIVAFLNRSMAYIFEGRPELAAVDAYRAAQAIEMIKNSNHQKRYAKESEIRRYLRIESSRILHKHEWTRGTRRFIPGADGGFTKRPLASLVMDMDEADCPVWHDPGINLDEMCARLEIRAMYRLCGALFKCRGGAAQDALGLLSDVLWTHTCFGPEAQCFQDLGDEILKTVTQVIDMFRKDGRETEDEHIWSMPRGDTRVFRTKPESMMKTRVTLSPALQYWDDIYEPDFANSNTYQELRDFAAPSSDSCMPAAIDQSSIGLLPHIELRASKDHLPGDIMFCERSPWHLTTSSPETVLNTWSPNKAGYLRLYCDTCATAVLMPEELVMHIVAQSAAPRTSDIGVMVDLSQVVGDDGMEAEKRQRRFDWSASTHITFCAREHEALYCCTTCRRNRRSFDPGIHESKIELELRDGKVRTDTAPKDNVSLGHPQSFYSHSKTQTLYDLLLLRIYASAVNDGKHPLELVKFVRGNLGPPSAHTPSQTGVPWSFHNNIVRPIWSINRYHQALGQDPLSYLRESDGWVINTLLAKIRHSTEITRGAMSAIIYNMDKESKTYCFRGLEEWVSDKADAVYESKEAYCEVWVARLDPLTSMIRVADEAKGEKPNCWLKYDESTHVIAGQPDDPFDKKDMAIKQGEVLLRPKPKFLGGSPYEVTTYSQRNPAASANTTKEDGLTEQNTGRDHEPANMENEVAGSPERNQVAVPDSVAESLDSDSDSDSDSSDNSSDEEMLELLDDDDDDDDSPEPLKSPPELSSPNSPPFDPTDIGALDGQAEQHQESATTLPFVEADPRAGEDKGSRGRKHKNKKRRRSHEAVGKGKLGSKHWSGHSRVRKPVTFRPPRNSLFETLRVVNMQRVSPQPEFYPPSPSPEVDYDSFDDAPVGTILTSDDFFEDEFDRQKTPSMDDVRKRALALQQGGVSPAAHADTPDRSSDTSGAAVDLPRVEAPRSKSPGKRTFSVACMGEGHDPGEGSSGSVKGKAKVVIRGGSAGDGNGNRDARQRARSRASMDRVQAWFERG